MDLEGFERVPIVGGGEDERRKLRRRQGAQNTESVHLRHLDVENHQIGPMLANSSDGFASTRALGGDGNVRLSREQVADAVASRRFVVPDDGLKSHGLWRLELAEEVTKSA